MPTKYDLPTDEEEAAIQAGIAQDRDNPEWTDENSRALGRAVDVLPAGVTEPRRRGPGRKPAKVVVSLRLDPDVADGLRASGVGWQGRANDALRAVVYPSNREAVKATKRGAERASKTLLDAAAGEVKKAGKPGSKRA